MWISLVLFSSACFSLSQTVNWCEHVLPECQKSDPLNWPECYEKRVMTCKIRGRGIRNFVQKDVNSSEEAAVEVTSNVKVWIPPSALQKSRGTETEDMVRMVASVLNSTLFKSRPQRKGRMGSSQQPDEKEDSILGWTVLSVRSGTSPVKNLTEPIKLTFKYTEKVESGSCVFWKMPEKLGEKGEWSTDGCQTTRSGDEFICSSNHMSFFAVLVNPDIPTVDVEQVKNLSYITYVGSALSVVFAAIGLVIYICALRRGRSEKAIGIHMQLTAALFFLHLSFLLSSFWFRMLEDQDDGWVCRGLGLILHWSLLATLTWLALEGFHLYLLLIRVFNIYVRRYVLKLSLLGWGFPTLVAVACGISGVYGKFDLEFRDGKDSNSTAPMCWMSSEFKHRQVVGYITVGFLCLVVLYNACMLVLVVFKLYGIRGGRRGQGSWNKMKLENGSQLWKDCSTVLGLSFVLGLPWGFTSTTYVSLTGIYTFTILNSLQGLFMFLWSVALSCKSQSDYNSTVKDPSSQKMMSTSF